MVEAKRHLSTRAAILIAAVLSAANAQQAHAGQSIAVEPKIANFAVVSPNIYRGAVPGPEGIQELQNIGVKTIIDLRVRTSHSEEKVAKAHGIRVIHLPMGYMAPSDKVVKQALKILSDARHGGVFIHCRQGADRTGTIVALYRIMVENWSFNRAYKEMRQHHFKPWLFTLKEKVETCAEHSPVSDTLAIHGQLLTAPPLPDADPSNDAPDRI